MLTQKITFTLIVAFTFVSCKPEKSPPQPVANPDAFAASFKIYESFYNGYKVDTDTIVRFAALFSFEDVYNEYKWQVGNEEFFTRDVSLRFGEEDMNAPIPVTLFAKKNFYVNGNLITKADTVTRMLVLKALEKSNFANMLPASKVAKSPFFGNFSGAFIDAPSDVFTIMIADHGNNPSPSFSDKSWNARIYNLPKGCGGSVQLGNCVPAIAADVQSQLYAPQVDPGYLGFTATGGANASGSCCPEASFNGVITNEARDSIRIECELRYGGGPVQTKVFLGKKI